MIWSYIYVVIFRRQALGVVEKSRNRMEVIKGKYLETLQWFHPNDHER